MLINKNIVNALALPPDETILMILRPSMVKSSPTLPLSDTAKYRIVTTKKIVQLNFILPTQTTQITDSLPFEKIIDLKLCMRHKAKNRERFFYIAATKVPILEIKTTDQSYTFSLEGILFLKKKMRKLVDLITEANANVSVQLNYKRDDMSEAYNEILFDQIQGSQKTRLVILLVILVVVFSIAIWRVINHLNTFTGY